MGSALEGGLMPPRLPRGRGAPRPPPPRCVSSGGAGIPAGGSGVCKDLEVEKGCRLQATRRPGVGNGRHTWEGMLGRGRGRPGSPLPPACLPGSRSPIPPLDTIARGATAHVTNGLWTIRLFRGDKHGPRPRDRDVTPPVANGPPQRTPALLSRGDDHSVEPRGPR